MDPGFQGDASARYDYLYDEQELAPWAARIERVDREAEAFAAEIGRTETGSRTRVYFNNHPGGKAVVNAEMMQRLLHLPGPRRRISRPSAPGSPIRHPKDHLLGEFLHGFDPGDASLP
ncbi:MAG: DUF72 domain-containing protein [Thermoplasmatota archaeon]